MSRMSRSLTPSAYSPGKGRKERRGRKERENIRRARENRQDALLTFSLRPFPRTAPHGPCPGQRGSRDRRTASCGLTAESRPSLRAQAPDVASATSPDAVLHSSSDGTACCPRPSQQMGPVPALQDPVGLGGSGKRCEQRIQAKWEALSGGRLGSQKGAAH